MACAQPMQLPNPHYREYGYYNFTSPFIEVPCGWCLNCRLDRQTWLSDAMTYEQKKYNYACAFVTLTYDDVHIQKLSNIKTDNFYYYTKNGDLIVAPYATSKEVVYSTCKKDCQDFLKRIRSRIYYYYKKHNIKNCDLCRKDFKYAYSTEYGDKFGRPHAHFCFFGLDWQFCQDLICECWEYGLIDCKPIQTGCFKYITKYITKQVKGDMARQMFDDKGIERPVFCHSLGLGKGIILDQYDYIRSHNLCYKTDNDTLRPIPIYYRNHYYHARPKGDYSTTCNNMLQARIKQDMTDSMYKKHGIRYSIKKMNDFRHAQAVLRHRQLEKQCEFKGIPYMPLVENTLVSFDTMPLANLAFLKAVPF